jgi:G3E family GTPase
MIVDIVFGFLGAGKTTFISRVLREWDTEEKTVVLVNEFGEVGIDGDLLSMTGANVVEMPSGCICCTLQADFKSQLLDIIHNIEPDRVIIEPTGVATISQIRSIVELQAFEATVRRINDILITDAAGFMDLYKANRHFVESQIENAHIVVLNKCDKVDKRKAMLTRSAITAINPEISVLTAEFGAVDRAEYQLALSSVPRFSRGMATLHDHRPGETDRSSTASTDRRPFHFHEEEDALGYESFGRVFTDRSFHPGRLEAFFQMMNGEEAEMGDIVRAKGIFRIGDKGLLMELASGELSSQPTNRVKESKASIIGKGLNRDKISAALEQCATEP